MHIVKLLIENYKVLEASEINFNPLFNLLVGNNESGKTSVLEALNLALTAQLNGRSILYELHPFLFNFATVSRYIAELKEGNTPQPPQIIIELFFDDDTDLSKLKGTNNSLREDACGVKFSIEFDESYANEYAEYISDPTKVRTLPIEYYKVVWRSFSGENITARSIPFRPSLIDATNIRHSLGANRYVLDIVRENLSVAQRAQLSLSYRKLKDIFLEDESVKAINDYLETKKGDVTDKSLSVSLDSTSKSNWETGIMPHLDEIPLPLAGKGEQNSMKIKLSMDAASTTNIFMIEEPENHLSHPNLNSLISRIGELAGDRQTIITTHSSFVMNKLGVENVLLFVGESAITLESLSPETRNYFLKLPGHDTLRLILAKRAILVEGSSDELLVQKAFHKLHGCMPLAAGVEVISVNGLAFKRFLEIAELLKIEVSVVTDNDGDVDALKEKYKDFDGSKTIRVLYDADTDFPTLEPQLLKANDLTTINRILGKSYTSEEDLLKHMKGNKTDCALKFFDTNETFNIPTYIENAVT